MRTKKRNPGSISSSEFLFFMPVSYYIKNTVPISDTVSFNRSDVIRTRDLYVPNVALYQAEPHSDIYNF